MAMESVQLLLATMTLFYALARPCKQNHANFLECLLIGLTAFVMLLISSIRFHYHIFTILLLISLCLLTPHVLGGYVIFKVTKRIGVNYHHLWNLSCKCILKRMCVPVERGEDNCLICDQLCPNECSPLLSEK